MCDIEVEFFCHAAKADPVETNPGRRDLGLRAADFSTVVILGIFGCKAGVCYKWCS